MLGNNGNLEGRGKKKKKKHQKIPEKEGDVKRNEETITKEKEREKGTERERCGSLKTQFWQSSQFVMVFKVKVSPGGD